MPTPLDRAAFDLPADLLWVMHCSEGPVPWAAAQAATEFMDREIRPWRVDWEADFIGLPARTRAAAARVLGARAEDVTLAANTSDALARVASGYPWRDGDEVVVPLGEFPSNYWPWRTLQGRGVGLREVTLWEGQRAGHRAWESAPPDAAAEPEERLLAALGPRTRVLSVSWVRFQDGLVLDLARLAEGCRARDVELVVDGIQGAGCLPLELDGDHGWVGAFATGCYKGLLTPQGSALLVTRADFRARLAPPGGWLGLEQAHDFSRPSTDFRRGWSPDATALEGGVPNLLGCAAFAVSLELLADAGPERVARHVAALQRRLLDRLAGVPALAGEAGRLSALRDAGRVGPILALHHGGRGPGGLDGVLAAARRRGIHASAREGYLRVALHGWHREEDVERLAGWLTESWGEGDG